MRNAEIKCRVCFSLDLVKVITKNTKSELVVCRECNQVYELDSEGHIIFHDNPSDVKYFKELEKKFGGWDNVISVTEYTELNLKGES